MAIWPLCLAVRTPPFHGGSTGSNPVGVTISYFNKIMPLEFNSSDLKLNEINEFHDSVNFIGDIPDFVTIHIYGGNAVIDGNVGRNCHIETLSAKNIIHDQSSKIVNKSNNLMNAYLPSKASSWIASAAKSAVAASSSIINLVKSGQEQTGSIAITGNVDKGTVIIAKNGSINIDKYVASDCILKSDKSIKVKKEVRNSTLLGNDQVTMGNSSKTVAIAKDEDEGIIDSNLNTCSLLHAQQVKASPASFRTQVSSPNKESSRGK